MVDSASVFRYLFLAKKKPLGLCNNSPTMQRTQIRWRKQRGRTATMQKICCWAGWERAEGATECADRSGFSLLKWDIKLSLSAHAFLTFIEAVEEGKRCQTKKKWSVCFALNTAHILQRWHGVAARLPADLGANRSARPWYHCANVPTRATKLPVLAYKGNTLSEPWLESRNGLETSSSLTDERREVRKRESERRE